MAPNNGSWLVLSISMMLLTHGMIIIAKDQAIHHDDDDDHDDMLINDHQMINDDDPYRTAYHFQSPKNWMNGMQTFVSLFTCFN